MPFLKCGSEFLVICWLNGLQVGLARCSFRCKHVEVKTMEKTEFMYGGGGEGG